MAPEPFQVLLVDDDRELSTLLGEYIGLEGFTVDTADSGEAALARLADAGTDIVVLDVMMPHMSGIEVLPRLRAFSGVPVLMLTARGDDIDGVLALELGADDYVQKPCPPRELVARLLDMLQQYGSQDSSGSVAAAGSTLSVSV